jgi:putative flippase GtrA
MRRTIGEAWGRQTVRFLVVGGGNTVGGYAIASLTYYGLHDVLPLVAIIAIYTVLGITLSYVTLKCLVFRTRGNYIAEYLRFYVVYAASIGMNFILMPASVGWLGMNPYLAMALIGALTVLISFFGHRHFSFRGRPQDGPSGPRPRL